MSTPAHLLYTKDHEWIHIHDDHTATIGITDFAQSELGDIVFVELNDVGDECAGCVNIYGEHCWDQWPAIETVQTLLWSPS